MYCLLLLWARLKIYASHYVMYEISMCMCVKQQTIYILNHINCIYIVVINCGWNNNVAVQIVSW